MLVYRSVRTISNSHNSSKLRWSTFCEHFDWTACPGSPQGGRPPQTKSASERSSHLQLRAFKAVVKLPRKKCPPHWWQQDLTSTHSGPPWNPTPVILHRRLTIAWLAKWLAANGLKTWSNPRHKDCSRTSCNLAESWVSWWKNDRDIGKTVSNGISELGSSFCLP